MPRSSRLSVTLGVSAVLILATVFTQKFAFSTLFPSYAVSEIGERNPSTIRGGATSTIYFTGDVMLARHVETLMRREGVSYPYGDLSWLREDPAYVVGNFESALPEIHQKTPAGAFRFSTAAEFIPALQGAGFTHLSLANNHALDHGEEGIQHATEMLASSSLVTFGHPVKVSTSSISYLTVADRPVALIGLHTLFIVPSEETLKSVLSTASASSTFQIVYVHWGNEYEPLPSVEQRALASTLVRLGADLIIGHHPHVIQAVEDIDGVPVFYSLGNFIFDQYFSAAVQDGLVVKLTAVGEGYELTLLPVTSRDRQARPRLMTEHEREATLAYLAKISDESLRPALLLGSLRLPHELATLSKPAIIGE